MKVLGIDTSTSCGSVGLIDDEWVISEYLLNVPVTHSERLLSAIELVLREAGCVMGDLDGWAICLGPGSFTGLRIGVSTVKGLAFVTGKPVVGISTLDVLASQIAPTAHLICPILDARKKEVYTAFYRYEDVNPVRKSPTFQRDGSHGALDPMFAEKGIVSSSPLQAVGLSNGVNLLKRISAYQAIGPEDLIKKIEERTIFVGDAVKTYREYLQKSLPFLAIFPPFPLHVPHGSVVARLGLELLHKGELLDLSTFTPLYIRPSEAEMKWQETHPD